MLLLSDSLGLWLDGTCGALGHFFVGLGDVFLEQIIVGGCVHPIEVGCLVRRY